MLGLCFVVGCGEEAPKSVDGAPESHDMGDAAHGMESGSGTGVGAAVEDLGGAVTEAAGDAAETVKEAAGDAAETVKEAGDDAVEAVKEDAGDK